jgi:hypothetical protein
MHFFPGMPVYYQRCSVLEDNEVLLGEYQFRVTDNAKVKPHACAKQREPGYKYCCHDNT